MGLIGNFLNKDLKNIGSDKNNPENFACITSTRFGNIGALVLEPIGQHQDLVESRDECENYAITNYPDCRGQLPQMEDFDAYFLTTGRILKDCWTSNDDTDYHGRRDGFYYLNTYGERISDWGEHPTESTYLLLEIDNKIYQNHQQ